MKQTGQTHAKYFFARLSWGKRNSSQRDHPAVMPNIASGV
jgi:hypothetical protein